MANQIFKFFGKSVMLMLTFLFVASAFSSFGQIFDSFRDEALDFQVKICVPEQQICEHGQ